MLRFKKKKLTEKQTLTPTSDEHSTVLPTEVLASSQARKYTRATASATS